MNNTELLNSARGNPSKRVQEYLYVCCTILGAVTDKEVRHSLSKLFAGSPLFISKEYLSIYGYNPGTNITKASAPLYLFLCKQRVKVMRTSKLGFQTYSMHHPAQYVEPLIENKEVCDGKV